jgi:hypothetical protein
MRPKLREFQQSRPDYHFDTGQILSPCPPAATKNPAPGCRVFCSFLAVHGDFGFFQNTFHFKPGI